MSVCRVGRARDRPGSAARRTPPYIIATTVTVLSVCSVYYSKHCVSSVYVSRWRAGRIIWTQTHKQTNRQTDRQTDTERDTDEQVCVSMTSRHGPSHQQQHPSNIVIIIDVTINISCSSCCCWWWWWRNDCSVTWLSRFIICIKYKRFKACFNSEISHIDIATNYWMKRWFSRNRELFTANYSLCLVSASGSRHGLRTYRQWW